MDGKHPISSKHSKNTQPGVCVQCLRNNSCDIHLQWCLCRCVSCSIVERKQLLVESSFREMKRTARSRSETWVCLFILIFFFLSSFRRLGHGRSISANYVPWVLDGRLWVKHVSTSVAALSPRDKIWGDKLGGEKAENGVGSDTSCFRTPLISWPMEIPRANGGGGGNAVSWSKQPLSLIIITELQLDLEPHQDSGRSGSMESLTLRWINEGIIMRFCKTHSCVRGQKHPIVLQPWQENLAVNTLVLKLGL